MEAALRSCCRNIRLGKVLVQRDEETALPKFYMAKLPLDIASRHVLLLGLLFIPPRRPLLRSASAASAVF